MALIECYECKGKVSSEAKACPHCGLPIEVKIEYHKSCFIFRGEVPTGFLLGHYIEGFAENCAEEPRMQMKCLTFLKDGKKHGLWTRWHKNGQKEWEANYKDGKEHGLWTSWYENGQKRSEKNYNYEALMTAKSWKPNGEKCPVTKVKYGFGCLVNYDEDGTEWYRRTYHEGIEVNDWLWDGYESWKYEGEADYYFDNETELLDNCIVEWHGQRLCARPRGDNELMWEGEWREGKLISAEGWQPLGERCPVTNVKDGNGVVVAYYWDGREYRRLTYKDGKLVKD